MLSSSESQMVSLLFLNCFIFHFDYPSQESVSNGTLKAKDLAKKRRRRGKSERMRDQNKSLLQENEMIKKKIEEIEKQLKLAEISQQQAIKQSNDVNVAEIKSLKDQVCSLKDLVSDYEVKNQVSFL